MEKRIISTQITEEDYGIENSLRPLSLDDYVGQNKVKSNLKVYIEAAKERGDSLCPNATSCAVFHSPSIDKAGICGARCTRTTGRITTA